MQLFVVIKIVLFAFRLLETETKIYGAYEIAAYRETLKEALNKLNVSSTNVSSNFNANSSLNQFIEKVHDVTKQATGHGNSSVFIFNDFNNMRNGILSEYLYKATGNKRTYIDNTFSGTDQISNHLSEVDELIEFADYIPLLPKIISVAVDDSPLGRASLARIVQKCAEKGLHISSTQIITVVSPRSILALNSHKSNVLFIDADEVKTAKITRMVKSLGVTGYREVLNWMLTKRSTGHLSRDCHLLPHKYRYIDHVPASITSDYIVRKVESEMMSKTKQWELRVRELDIESKVWLKLNTSTLQIAHNQTAKYHLSRPVIRVGIADTSQPWLFIEDMRLLHVKREECGRQGMMGERSLNGTDTEQICVHGYAVDILWLLRTHLEFEPVLYMSRDGKYGTYHEETGTADGIVREIIENKVDMAIDLMENKGRTRVLWFSNAHLIGSAALAYIQTDNGKESSIFGPFSTNLWLGIIGIIAGLIVIIWALEHISPYSGFHLQKRDIEEVEAFGKTDSFTYVWGTLFTGEIIDKKPKSFGSRAIIVAFSLVAVVVISAYSGNLITYLVVLDETPPVTGLLDPKIIGDKRTMKVGFVGGTFIDGLIMTHKDLRTRNLYSEMTKCRSMEECINKLKKREIQLLLSDGPSLRYYASLDHSCSMRVLDLPETSRAIGITTRKDWPGKRIIDTAISRFVETGKIDYIMSKWFKKTPCKQRNIFTSLGINRMKSLFILLAGLIAGCIFICLMMMCASCVIKKRKIKREKENQITDSHL